MKMSNNRRYNCYNNNKNSSNNNNNKGTFYAAAARNKTTTTTTTTKTYTAQCSANQKVVDELVKVRERAGSSNFGFTVKRAIESVVAYPDPITTYQQALTLKFVGPTIANIIVPKSSSSSSSSSNNNSNNNTNNINSSSNNNKATRKRKAAPEPSLSQGTTSTTTTTTTTTTGGQRRRQRQRLVPPNTDNSNNNNDSSSSATAAAAAVAATTDAAKTAKQIAYDKAVADAERVWQTLLSSQPPPQQQHKLRWKVVLLIDGREQQSDHMQAKCLQSGIPTEERHLPIGDMAWMAQGYYNADVVDGKDRENEVIKVELMLGTIMERKTTADLKASLFGTRYAEQRLRLQQTGLPQVLFLIEGDLNNADHLFKCPADTLHSAMWETRMHLGFRVIQTAHMDDTVRTLKRMHRRILQRTFPQAFQTEALPTFVEAGVDHQEFGHRRRQQQQQQERDVSLSPAFGDQSRQRRRRHRRRRIESLVELSFDTNPTPMPGMARFMTYQELKAKVEMDRHEATRSVGKLHLAMLKQVSTVSSRKCHAVARQYPTASLLLQAYDDVHDGNDDNAAAYADDDDDEDAAVANKKRTLLTNLATANPNATSTTSARDLKIGPRSAEELYIAYGFADPEDEAMRVSSRRCCRTTTTTTTFGGGEGCTDNDNNIEENTAAFVLPNIQQQQQQQQHCSTLSVLEEVNKDVFTDAVKIDTRKPTPVAPCLQDKEIVCLDDDSDDDDHHQVETKENAANVSTTTPAAALASTGNAAAATTTSSSRTTFSVQKGFLDMSWDTSMDITPSRFPSKNVASLPRRDSNNDRVLLDLSQNDDDDDEDQAQTVGIVGLKKDTLDNCSSFSSSHQGSKSVSESRAIFMDGGSDDDGDDYCNSDAPCEQEKSQEVEIIELD